MKRGIGERRVEVLQRGRGPFLWRGEGEQHNGFAHGRHSPKTIDWESWGTDSDKFLQRVELKF